MKDDKKYHRGGRVPTPRGQVPHPPIGRPGIGRGRGRKGLSSTAELQKRMALANARRRMQQDALNRRLRGGRLQPGPQPFPLRPMPMQPPRPVKGATPIQATPQPMEPAQAVPATGSRPNAGTPRPRRRSGRQIREDMNRRMRRTRRR